MVFSLSSLSLVFFSNSRILEVSTVLISATTKYIKNNRVSSGSPIVKVIVGGMKKKFQINALKIAVVNTGKMSNNIANTETASNKIRATTLYPIKSTKR